MVARWRRVEGSERLRATQADRTRTDISSGLAHRFDGYERKQRRARRALKLARRGRENKARVDAHALEVLKRATEVKGPRQASRNTDLDRAAKTAERISVDETVKGVVREADDNRVSHAVLQRKLEFEQFKKRWLWPGLVMLALSVPPAISGYIFEINDMLRAHHIDPGVLGVIGTGAGITFVANFIAGWVEHRFFIRRFDEERKQIEFEISERDQVDVTGPQQKGIKSSGPRGK